MKISIQMGYIISQVYLPTIHEKLPLWIKRYRKNVLPMMSDYAILWWFQYNTLIPVTRSNHQNQDKFVKYMTIYYGFYIQSFEWMSMLPRVRIPNTNPSKHHAGSNAKGPMYAKTTLPIIWEWCPFSLSLFLIQEIGGPLHTWWIQKVWAEEEA